MPDILALYFLIPPITRAFITVSVGLLLLDSVLVPVWGYLYWSSYLVYYKYHVWRIFTGFFVPNMIRDARYSSFISIYAFYNMSSKLENDKFQRDTASYIYYLLITGSAILASTCVFTMMVSSISFFPMFLFHPLLSAVTYTYSRLAPHSFVTLIVFNMRAKYLPCASLAVSLVLGGPESFLIDLSGLIGGYLYDCLENKDFGPLATIIYERFFPQRAQRYLRERRQPGRAYGINSTPQLAKGRHIPAPHWLRAVVSFFQEVFAEASDARPRVFRGGKRLGTTSDSSGDFFGRVGGYSASNASSSSSSSNSSSIKKSSGTTASPGGSTAVKNRFPGKGTKLGT